MSDTLITMTTGQILREGIPLLESEPLEKREKHRRRKIDGVVYYVLKDYEYWSLIKKIDRRDRIIKNQKAKIYYYKGRIDGYIKKIDLTIEKLTK